MKIGNMESEITSTGKFKFIEGGEGEPLILLHGLLGALSNFRDVFEHFKSRYNVIVLKLPLYDLSQEPSVSGLAKYVHKFIESRQFDKVHLLGNSSGGHVSLVYTLNHPEKIRTLTLTGSSGLFENGMGETYPKRGDYEFIRRKTELTFYDPAIATKELVDDIYDTVNNRLKAIKIIALAKSAIRNNLSKELGEIKVPTCLIWGRNDTVTPPLVAEEFKKLLPNSELHWIDKCGHAPMMEVPEEFNRILAGFLDHHKI
jgi:pimeloyl-ACP methyl ester carboxylesterase